MNRADTQFTLQAFFDRLAAGQIADAALGEAYVAALRAYAGRLAQDDDDIDQWTVEEYERACEYLHNNSQWILHADVAARTLAAAHAVFAGHRSCLLQNGASEENLAAEPHPSYRQMRGAAPEFVP